MSKPQLYLHDVPVLSGGVLLEGNYGVYYNGIAVTANVWTFLNHERSEEHIFLEFVESPTAEQVVEGMVMFQLHLRDKLNQQVRGEYHALIS